MPKHGPEPSITRRRQAARARELAAARMPRTDIEALSIPAQDLVAHHEYTLAGKELQSTNQPSEDRDHVRVSPLFTAAPERKRGRLAHDWNRQAERGLGRRDFWDRTLERHDPGRILPLMVRTEIRQGQGRNFTGGKSSSPAATNARAAEIASGVRARYALLHHK